MKNLPGPKTTLMSLWACGSCLIGCLKPLAALSGSVVAMRVVVLDVEEVVVRWEQCVVAVSDELVG